MQIWMQVKILTAWKVNKTQKWPVKAGMDNNTASLNTKVQEPHMVDLETTMNNKYGVRSGHSNLWPRKERSTNKWSNAFLFGFSMTQYYINQGLKLLGMQEKQQYHQNLINCTRKG